jgi:hypothetical protein
MKSSSKILATAMLGLSLAAFSSSCSKGPAEKAGENIDNAVQDTKDAAKDLKDDVKKKF